MASFRAIDVIVVILNLQIGISWCQPSLKFRVNEETGPGFVLGNINSHIIANFEDSDKYEVYMIDKYFSISKNRDLIVKKRIDLEKFCNEASLCCETSQCIVPISVMISNLNNGRNRFNIEIEVIDINDNLPTFRSSSQILNIPENSKIGTPISVEGGYDTDVSQVNQIQFYKLEEPTRTFKLDSSDMASLILVLDKSVDYERIRMYNAQLYACDNATRCVSQQIIINIQDENDNYPTFVKTKFEVQIPESFEVGRVVIAARAIDKDGAQYNKTKYTFYNNRDSNLAMKFKINPSNGDIILKSKLSASQREKYMFKISATDVGQYIYGTKDIADVVINILDINDNRPVIEIYKSEKMADDKDTFEMKILENEQPRKLMSIKVSDADLGLNAKVMCELKGDSSSLESKYFHPDIYEISSTRSFDYEHETEIKAIFECKDSGIPQLSSYKSIQITIEDVNEYTPEFDQTEYHGSVKENSASGEIVLTIRAVDKDGGAVLTYSIEESVTQYFSINPHTGVIKTASVPFDREQTASKSFKVTVTDALLNSRTADATVRINIIDDNDNDPIFLPSSLQFFISENQPKYSKLHGKIYASDNDKDAANSFVSYSLVETFDSQLKKCEKPYFLMKSNGEVETLYALDREMNSNFTLTIEARDKGNPYRYTRANASVIVHDINDNPPQWIYPRPSADKRNIMNTLPMLNLTENTKQFLLIMKLKAYDPDQNEAGIVSYELVSHHDALFSLNETNGELRTERSPLPYGQYQLQLRATDHGTPTLYSDSFIMVNIIDSGKLTNINLTIIIGLVGITALISIFLIVAIICVRRRPRFQQSYVAPPSDTTKEQSNQYFSHNQWMFQPTDETLMPPLSDNESCVYLQTGFYEQQDPLILHSLSGSRPASRLDYPLVLPSAHHGNTAEHKYGQQQLQNMERTSGMLRLNNGQYGTLNASTSGIVISGQELDGDSADSGKGASEVDLRLQNQLNNANRNYPTMPFSQHQPTTTSTFGYQNNLSGLQYYSVHANPKSFDSRFLTMHSSSAAGTRRAMSPAFSASNPCQCFMLPENDVIEVEHDYNHVPMTTLSQHSLCNMNHEHNHPYGDEIQLSLGAEYYSHCSYIQGPIGRASQSPVPFMNNNNNSGTEINHKDLVDNIRDGDKSENYSKMFENKRKNNYSSSDQLNQENNIYTLETAN